MSSIVKYLIGAAVGSVTTFVIIRLYETRNGVDSNAESEVREVIKEVEVPVEVPVVDHEMVEKLAKLEKKLDKKSARLDLYKKKVFFIEKIADSFDGNDSFTIIERSMNAIVDCINAESEDALVDIFNDSAMKTNNERLTNVAEDADELMPEGDYFSQSGESVNEDSSDGTPLPSATDEVNNSIISDRNEKRDEGEDGKQKEKKREGIRVEILRGKNSSVKKEEKQVAVNKEVKRIREFDDGSVLFRCGRDTFVWNKNTVDAIDVIFRCIFGGEDNDVVVSSSSDKHSGGSSGSTGSGDRGTGMVSEAEESSFGHKEESKDENGSRDLEEDAGVVESVESTKDDDNKTEYSEPKKSRNGGIDYKYANQISNMDYRSKYYFPFAKSLDSKNDPHGAMLVYILNFINDIVDEKQREKFIDRLDGVLLNVSNDNIKKACSDVEKLWSMSKS